MRLQWSTTEPPISKSQSCKKHNAYLVRNATGICSENHTWRGSYSCLSVLLLFTRDKTFYISTVFVPGIVLVTSSFISFWLDIHAVPARVMIGVTTMLNFCTTTNSFRSTLPVVANLTAMNLWDGVCIFFIYASMLEFIIVNYLGRQIPKGSKPSNAAQPSFPPPPTENNSRERTTLDPLDSPSHKPSNGADPSNDPTSPLTHDIRSAPYSDTNQINHRLRNNNKLRATASVFAWLRRQQYAVPTAELSPKVRLAKTIDNVSRTVFPLLFGIFVFGFFLTYAFIKPAEADDETLKEFGITS